MRARRFFAILALVGLTAASQTPAASALSGAQFKAGRIINDSVFFNPNAMTAAHVQSFLEAKGPDSCDTNGAKSHSYYFNASNGRVNDERDAWVTTTRAVYGQRVQNWLVSQNKPTKGSLAPFVCLKDFTMDIPAREPEDSLCRGLTAANNKSAAYIIDSVARSCGVSQKVLLVLLEKEQSLLSDDWPWGIQYNSATGYACPDTSACNNAYAGFVKQVYYAARVYKYYAKYPDNFNHVARRNNNILWHPNASCGSSTVFIENQATAGLYNYTPYRPNTKALQNLYGTGDSCSAYGNRNFWRMFSDWFGSTLDNPPADKILTGDWDGDGDDTLGIKRGNLYLLDNNNDGKADESIFYGRVQDQPLVGDWDGDGDDTISMKIGSTYYINNDLDAYSDSKFSYGRPQDVPLAGDWDGDGDDTIGIRIGDKYFVNNNLDGISELKYVYARPGDITMVGDWDGDGDDTVSAKIGSNYYINNDFDERSELKFTYGRAADMPIVGDWDNDDDHTIGVRIGSNKFFLNNAFDGVTDSKVVFVD